MSKLNILAFGAGAIGTYIGGSLALSGHRLVFLEQPQAVSELKKQGLLLDLRADPQRPPTGSAVCHVDSATFVPTLEEALSFGPFDVAIFALKSFDTVAVVDRLQSFRDQLPPFLCLSNGVENELLLETALGPDKVIAGTVTSAVGRRGVGNIVLERKRGVGLVSTHPLSDRLLAALNKAGLNAQTFPRVADMKWSKMLTNLPANATAAILDMTPAEVFAHRGLFDLEMKMLREALAVMSGLDIRVVDLPGVPVRALALGTKLPQWMAQPLMKKAVGGGRGGKMPSFHIDLHSGRGKSEVEWLNGAVVRYGAKAGVPTPVNRLLTEILLALTHGEIPLSEFSRKPEKLLEKVQEQK
jgi:2-dehydropantoate 2-reductase